MAKNLAIAVAGPCIAAATTKVEASDAEWSEFMSALRTGLARSVADTRILIFTDGAIPSAAQRKQFSELVKGHDVRIAVHTHSVAPRFAVASISLFIKSISAYPPKDFPKACQTLALSVGEKLELRSALVELDKTIEVSALRDAVKA